MSFRVLDIVKPLEALMPEIELPFDKVSFDEKVLYTLGAAVIYLLGALPLYGVRPNKLIDPFQWLRFGMGSDIGTTLEFGVLPVVTAAFFWQILAGFRIVKVNFSSISERQRFQSLQKLTALFLGLLYAILLASTGYFEASDAFTRQDLVKEQGGFWSNLIIVTQLTIGTGVVTYLCELLEKGYGFGPGVMGFLAISASTKFAGGLLGIVPHALASEPKAEGVIIQLVNNFLSAPFKAIYDSFNRVEYLNLTQVYFSLIIVGALLYLSNFRQDVSIKSAKVRSMVSTYPIRLFYCGALPLLFSWTILYNLNIFTFAFSKLVYSSDYLAKWELNALTNKTYNLTNGVLYLLSPNNTGDCLLWNVLRPLTFISFIILTSVIFSINWFSMAGSSGKDLARQFKDQEITVIGHRDSSMGRELNKMIFSASVGGALVLSSVVAVSESLGVSNGVVMGMSIGILSGLAVLESIISEFQQSGSANTQFAQVFGS